MRFSTTLLASVFASALLGCAGCSRSEGDQAIDAVNKQEAAWEANDPATSTLGAQNLIEMYNEIARKYPDVADRANDQVTKVGNLQTLKASGQVSG